MVIFPEMCTSYTYVGAHFVQIINGYVLCVEHLLEWERLSIGGSCQYSFPLDIAAPSICQQPNTAIYYNYGAIELIDPPNSNTRAKSQSLGKLWQVTQGRM